MEAYKLYINRIGNRSIIRRPIAPTSPWSDGPLVRWPIGPTAHWSDGPLVRDPLVIRYRKAEKILGLY